MIDASELHPGWVMDHIEDYSTGNSHIGAWQRLVQGRRWKELALKFTQDIRQLEMINRAGNSSNGRECKIMLSIQNTKRQFFTRLDGEGFELSEKTIGMDDESCESSSSSSSATSSSATSLREDRGDTQETKQS